MPQQKIRIRLKGYDHKQVDGAAGQIVETVVRSGATITGPVPLPTSKCSRESLSLNGLRITQ